MRHPLRSQIYLGRIGDERNGLIEGYCFNLGNEYVRVFQGVIGMEHPEIIRCTGERPHLLSTWSKRTIPFPENLDLGEEGSALPQNQIDALREMCLTARVITPHLEDAKFRRGITNIFGLAQCILASLQEQNGSLDELQHSAREAYEAFLKE